MNIIFQKQLNEELLGSEKKRTIILIGMFVFALCYQAAETLFFKPVDPELARLRNFKTVWLLPVAMIAFELVCLFYINYRLKSTKKYIPLVAQYINVALEICLLPLLVVSVAIQFPSYNVLHSPAMLIFFIFIIVSTLRLNFGLSFFCGLLAALSYSFISFFIYRRFSAYDDLVKAIVLLLSGIAAGLVARQIRKGIDLSLHETEKRHRAENLFGQQISTQVAKKMLASDGKIESKRMNVAIMFIDIRNFTNYASDKHPEEIVQYQNAFFTIVIDTVAKYGGVVNQFFGDGCMVTFGAPLPVQNPSEQAVSAATDILNELNNAIQSGNISPTRIGIGIHTGEAVTGNIGTATRQQYSITGNVVILASRIEQLNKTFHSQILISEDVIRSIGANRVEAELYGPVSLKGYEQPISIYKIA